MYISINTVEVGIGKLLLRIYETHAHSGWARSAQAQGHRPTKQLLSVKQVTPPDEINIATTTTEPHTALSKVYR